MSGKPIPTELRKQIQKALIKETDMMAEKAGEVLDVVVGGVDKFGTGDGVNIEPAAKLIKEMLDKAYGTSWHCIIGKGFSFDITAQNETYLQCFYQGDISAVVFKC